uniref:Conopeptide n=1 Tax=Conus lenavati TaxID=1519839 RepID=A0A0K8TTQ1_CONLV
MKLSVMFIVFLMLTMPMADSDFTPRAVNETKTHKLARFRAANSLVVKRECPVTCEPGCEGKCK